MKTKIIIAICITALLLLGFKYKIDLYDYDEVCKKYQQRVTAIGYDSCHTRFYIDVNTCWQYYYEYHDTDICIEYELVKKVKGVEPFLYDFSRVNNSDEKEPENKRIDYSWIIGNWSAENITDNVNTTSFNLSNTRYVVADSSGCLYYQTRVTLEEKCPNYSGEPHCYIGHGYYPTDLCIEYSNGTKLNIPQFIYEFVWCEVYPLSDDCLKKTRSERYVEECFEYKEAIREEYYCDSNTRHLSGCIWYQKVVKVHSIDINEIDCNCPSESIVKKNYTFTTRECAKYLPVRYV